MWPAREMNNMMNSLFSDPFGMMGQNALMAHRAIPQRGYRGNMQMTPFGFPPMPTFNLGGMFDMVSKTLKATCKLSLINYIVISIIFLKLHLIYRVIWVTWVAWQLLEEAVIHS